MGGNELLHACRQMCTADPKCVAFEIVETPLAPYYDYVGFGVNCCIEYSPITPSSELFVDSEALDPDSNCAKENRCWSYSSRIVDGDCLITTDSSPQCALIFPGATGDELELCKQDSALFLQDGCPAFDSVDQTLLDAASETCFTETEFPIEECAFEEEPQLGQLLFGVNQGGCFSCHEENDILLPLDGDDLIEACRQMCTADPLCVAFEVADPAILPMNSYRGDPEPGRNCCLEHDAVAPSHPMFIEASSRNSENNCHKEASCWSTISKKSPSTPCKLSNPSPLCDVRFPGYTSAQDFQDQNDWVLDFMADDCSYDDYSDASIAQALMNSAGDVCLPKLPQTNDVGPPPTEPTANPPTTLPAAPPINAPTLVVEQTKPSVIIDSGAVFVQGPSIQSLAVYCATILFSSFLFL